DVRRRAGAGGDIGLGCQVHLQLVDVAVSGVEWVGAGVVVHIELAFTGAEETPRYRRGHGGTREGDRYPGDERRGWSELYVAPAGLRGGVARVVRAVLPGDVLAREAVRGAIGVRRRGLGGAADKRLIGHVFLAH